MCFNIMQRMRDLRARAGRYHTYAGFAGPTENLILHIRIAGIAGLAGCAVVCCNPVIHSADCKTIKYKFRNIQNTKNSFFLKSFQNFFFFE